MNFLRVPLFCCLAGLGFLPGLSAQTSSPAATGFPASNHAWTGKDYVQAANSMADGKTPAPTLADEEGKALFQRLTSMENLSPYRNRSLPVGQRLEDCTAMMGALGTLLQRYADAGSRGVNVHQELAGLIAFMMRTAAVDIDLLNDFLPAVPHDDKYAARMQGLERMKSGLTAIFGGAELSLAKNTLFSPEDLSLLLESMAETLPTADKIFAPDYRTELRRKLESHRAAFPAEKDARNLQAAIDALGR